MKLKPTAEAGPSHVPVDREHEETPVPSTGFDRTRPCFLSLKNILVPVDFSRSSMEALGFAASFARPFGARLAVLHVVVTSCPVDPYGVNLPDYFKLDLVEQAKKQLDSVVGEAVPREVSSQCLTRQAQSWAANEIIQAAGELPADLIVLSTHGHTGLKHVVFGSTAEYIVRHAKCPVLTIRAREHQKNE